MPTMRVRSTAAQLATLAVVASATVTHGAGPMFVNGAGEPLRWTADPILYNPDRGLLGGLSSFAAVNAVTSAFDVWSDVPTASIRFLKGAQLPVDVTADNWTRYLGVCDQYNEIVFDRDGSIIDSIFGTGASNDILGFAGPACGTFVPPVINEGMALLNGKWVDGVSNGENPEIALEEFDGVLVHEFGHFLNLDHSQVNLAEAFDANSANNSAVATMFPYAVKGAGAAILHLDDKVSLSMLYPAATFSTNFGSFVGDVLRDGAQGFQGAYVIARRIGNPRTDAVGVASGARYVPGADGGPPPLALRGLYEIPGLPPGDYTLEIEEVHPSFVGGSSVGPLDPPARLPGDPEYYNGANEASANPPDAPTEWVAVTATAGIVEAGIDFVINGYPRPVNDSCTSARLIDTLPFVDVVETLGATTADIDPMQDCGANGPNQNSASVWYLLTATEDTYVSLDTVGSTYDTVLSAYTGSCFIPSAIACNDDWGYRVQSKITVRAAPEAPVLVEVTSLGASGGGTLVLHAGPPVSCGTEPATGCETPDSTYLRLTEAAKKERDRAIWTWRSNQGSAPFPFGDPTRNTDYAVCVYDTVLGVPALALSAVAPAASNSCRAKTCWRSKGLFSFAYRDPDSASNGLSQLTLKTALSGRTRIKLKGAGTELAMPDQPMTKQDRVIVQLLSSDGSCWESENRNMFCSGGGGLRCAYTP